MARHAALTAAVSPELEPLLTAREAMAILGCCRSFLTEHRAELGGIKVGTRLKFRRSRLDAYLDRQTLQEPAIEPEPVAYVAPTPIVAVRKYGKGPINPVFGRPYGSTVR